MVGVLCQCLQGPRLRDDDVDDDDDDNDDDDDDDDDDGYVGSTVIAA